MLDPRILTAWLLTYLLHSTLFLSLAWLAARGPLRRRPALEEAAWRFALVAALVTASVQLAAGREPLAGRWGLAAPARAAASMPASDRSQLTAPVHRAPLPVHAAVAAPAAASVPSVPARSSSRLPWTAWIAGLWAAGAAALGSRWLAAHLALRRRLRARPQVVGGDMSSALRRLAAEAGLGGSVRLSCSSRLPVPIALGLRRPEICVPPRALASLSTEQQEGMLAHELAHLVRRDPFWLAFGHFLSSVFFFQPLNQVARRRLRELSELRSDEWAVGQTGRPLSLARCLAEVAGWSIRPLGGLVAPGMADRPSHLAHRIRRLLDARSPERRVRPLWMAAGMAALLVAVVTAAPGVSAAGAGSPGSTATAEHTAHTASTGVAPAPGEPADPGPGPDVPAAEASREHQPDAAAGPETARREEAEAHAEMERSGDPDFDIDVDPHFELSGEQLASFGEQDGLSREEEKALEKKMEALNADIESRLKPQLEDAQRRFEKEMESFEKSPEMEKLRARAEELDRRSHPSKAEIEKLRTEALKMSEGGHMTEEQREHFREEARRMAEQYKLSEKDRAELQELARKAREEHERFMKEHGAEIEALRKQVLEQAEAMRQDIKRQMESDPEMKALIERHRADADRHRAEREKRDAERKRRRQEEKHDAGHDHSGGVSGGVRGGIPGGVSGGISGGVAGGVAGGVEGGVQ
jgi:beta-lactamase regulating signal transducer with metallopeptidase domain